MTKSNILQSNRTPKYYLTAEEKKIQFMTEEHKVIICSHLTHIRNTSWYMPTAGLSLEKDLLNPFHIDLIKISGSSIVIKLSLLSLEKT